MTYETHFELPALLVTIGLCNSTIQRSVEKPRFAYSNNATHIATVTVPD